MSRVGRQIIAIPAQTTVAFAAGRLTVKGPVGSVSREMSSLVEVLIEKDNVSVKTRQSATTPARRAIWGTSAAHIKNMVAGVNQPFVKRLIIEGVGYKVAMSGTQLTFGLGFSHPITVAIPSELKVTVEKNLIGVAGADKELVGRFAASLRDLKKPEPYKGKGIRYEGEVIRRKQGKRVVA